MPNDIKEGRQPWVLPCAQNHLTQADASLKHCHTRWPAEKPGKSLIVPHISIVFCLYFFLFVFFVFYCPICLKRSQIPQRRENAKRLEHPGREGHFFSIFLFSQYFSRGAAWVSTSVCYFLSGATWRWGIGWARPSLSVCVRVCALTWEWDSVCPSHGNPAHLIKSARAARVSGRRWPRCTDTCLQTNTHSHTLTHTAGPTSGQRQPCDVRPEDTCGQTSPSSAAAVAGERTTDGWSTTAFPTFFCTSSLRCKMPPSSPDPPLFHRNASPLYRLASDMSMKLHMCTTKALLFEFRILKAHSLFCSALHAETFKWERPNWKQMIRQI